MAKFQTYLIVGTGLSILFYFAGLITTNPLLTLLLNPESLSTSVFWSTLIGAITSVVGVVVGIFTKDLRIAAYSVVTPYLVLLVWNMVEVFIVIAAYSRPIAILLFAPLMMMFFVDALDWWSGKN